MTQHRFNLEAFNDCYTAADFIAVVRNAQVPEQDVLRTAESAAWTLWERQGKPLGHPLVGIAIAISNEKWTHRSAA